MILIKNNKLPTEVIRILQDYDDLQIYTEKLKNCIEIMLEDINAIGNNIKTIDDIKDTTHKSNFQYKNTNEINMLLSRTNPVEIIYDDAAENT